VHCFVCGWGVKLVPRVLGSSSEVSDPDATQSESQGAHALLCFCVSEKKTEGRSVGVGAREPLLSETRLGLEGVVDERLAKIPILRLDLRQFRGSALSFRIHFQSLLAGDLLNAVARIVKAR
jgi:hypothetical protein